MNKFQYLIVSTVVLLSTALLLFHTAYDGGMRKLLFDGDLPVLLGSIQNTVHRELGETASKDKKKEKIELKEAIVLAQGVLNLIRHRYELDGAGANLFRTANNIGPFTWDVIKYKFAKKIVGENPTFVMVFGGSSVTAGHDNYYNQSYPFVVERRLGFILEALGVDLTVHNIAQGNLMHHCLRSLYLHQITSLLHSSVRERDHS